MALKSLSNNTKFVCWTALSIVLFFSSGCAPRVLTPSPRPSKPTVQESRPEVGDARETNETTRKSNSRMLASLQLTDQAKILIADGNPDAALRILERAISLDPSNGQNYYYVAEAWIIKGNADQASEFNGLAAIYLGQGTEWMELINEQKNRIEELLENRH